MTTRHLLLSAIMFVQLAYASVYGQTDLTARIDLALLAESALHPSAWCARWGGVQPMGAREEAVVSALRSSNSRSSTSSS